jgi:hypothetical protein
MQAIIKRSNGSVRMVLLDIGPRRDEKNLVVAAVICFHDISARKAIEDQLRSHQDAEDFFENGAVALHLVGKDGTILREPNWTFSDIPPMNTSANLFPNFMRTNPSSMTSCNVFLRDKS